MKIVISESQLKNLVESYNDNYGFVDERNEDRVPLFDVLVSYDIWVLVKKKNSKDTYILNTDDVPYDYYKGYYTWVNDNDPDFEDDNSWEDAYREFEDDTQLYEDGIALFAEDVILNDDNVTNEENITTKVDEVFNSQYYGLKITPENKAEVYREFEDLIKAYFEPSYEERKKDKKTS